MDQHALILVPESCLSHEVPTSVCVQDTENGTDFK